MLHFSLFLACFRSKFVFDAWVSWCKVPRFWCSSPACGAWCLVSSARSLFSGSEYFGLFGIYSDISCAVLCAWCLLPALSLVPGACCLIGAWCLVPAWCLVSGAWGLVLVLGPWCLLPGVWCRGLVPLSACFVRARCPLGACLVHA